MSIIMVRGGFNAWPTLLTFLTDTLNQTGNDQNGLNPLQIKENAIRAISIIVEDCTSLFAED